MQTQIWSGVDPPPELWIQLAWGGLNSQVMIVGACHLILSVILFRPCHGEFSFSYGFAAQYLQMLSGDSVHKSRLSVCLALTSLYSCCLGLPRLSALSQLRGSCGLCLGSPSLSHCLETISRQLAGEIPGLASFGFSSLMCHSLIA